MPSPGAPCALAVVAWRSWRERAVRSWGCLQEIERVGLAEHLGFSGQRCRSRRLHRKTRSVGMHRRKPPAQPYLLAMITARRTGFDAHAGRGQDPAEQGAHERTAIVDQDHRGLGARRLRGMKRVGGANPLHDGLLSSLWRARPPASVRQHTHPGPWGVRNRTDRGQRRVNDVLSSLGYTLPGALAHPERPVP